MTSLGGFKLLIYLEVMFRAEDERRIDLRKLMRKAKAGESG